MCGIAGIVAFNDNGASYLQKIEKSVSCLSKRGPDAEGFYRDGKIALGHRRLSIIDTSDAGSQPMTDPSGRYTIIFNGEFFNYRDHRNQLINHGVQLHSESDTEVVLHLFIREGPSSLNKINGFFSLAIYDKTDQTLFVARDRFGVKPFYYMADADAFLFASEMKAVMAFGIRKQINKAALLSYLQLNYIPGPLSILEGVKKLGPGSWMMVSLTDNHCSDEKKFYVLNNSIQTGMSYHKAQAGLVKLMETAVQRRLVSDVPLGAFLSGGIDSSIIAGLASKHVNGLSTFSVGFKDEPLFDETHYARMVAKKFTTRHTVFSLGNEDLFAHLFNILDYTDEPFADSSAIAVYILSRETRKHVTVALSGDGADELFAGYNKHRAEWMIRNNRLFSKGMRLLAPLFSGFHGSRNSILGNKIRQLNRFSVGASLTTPERYWRWCGFTDEEKAIALFDPPFPVLDNTYIAFKASKTAWVHGGTEMNDMLMADVNMVLPDDMLTKVDRMSMANSLEVRTPFLDYEVVDFAFSIPSAFKIDQSQQKKILKDAFKDFLPGELYHRKKQGFEVPLLTWFRTGLKSLITDDLLSEEFVHDQKIFNPKEIQLLKNQLFSPAPGDTVARIWGLLVFQYWYKKYFLAS